jgi:hypothetical protein
MARDLRIRLVKEELRRLYLDEKKSLEDIARLYGASRVAVWKYCNAEGLIRRTRSDARLEAQKKGKVPQVFFNINERFFSTWSSEMAYVLGLIATDGCVSKSGTVSLCINDKDLLETVKRAMDSEHNVSPSRHQEKLYCFHFARPRLVKDLAALGILPRKSLNIMFPAVPNAFLRDFIRGVFDGDGSVYFEKRSVRYPLRATFVSSSEKFIEKLEIALQQLGLPRRVIHRQATKNGAHFKIRYSHKDSGKLFKAMYYDAMNCLFLERKHRKFLAGFEQERS